MQGVLEAAVGAVKDEGESPLSTAAQETDGLQQGLCGIYGQDVAESAHRQASHQGERESKAPLQ